MAIPQPVTGYCHQEAENRDRQSAGLRSNSVFLLLYFHSSERARHTLALHSPCSMLQSHREGIQKRKTPCKDLAFQTDSKYLIPFLPLKKYSVN